MKQTLLALLLLIPSLHASTRAQDTAAWKTLTNKGGWSIKYPPTWRAWSCRSCPDPTAPGVYVSFGAPSPESGIVMVEQLADRRPDQTADQALRETKRTNNQNPIVRETPIALNGHQGLRVTYRTASGTEMESTYVVSGTRLFAISCELQDSSVRRVCAQMVSTFALQAR